MGIVGVDEVVFSSVTSVRPAAGNAGAAGHLDAIEDVALARADQSGAEPWSAWSDGTQIPSGFDGELRAATLVGRGPRVTRWTDADRIEIARGAVIDLADRA